MRRNGLPRFALFGAVLAFAAATAFAAMSMASHEPTTEKHTVIKLKIDALDPDTLVLEDLHDLAVGESRSFTTDSGKVVVATRTEEGFELDVEGKTIKIADLRGEGDATVWHSHSGGDGEQKVFKQRIEISGEAAEGKTMVWHSAEGEGPHRIHVIKKLGDGGEGEGFAFSTGDDVVIAPFSAEGWIERLEQTESFQQLDEGTREIVRRALREAAKVPPAGRGVFLIDVEEESK